MSALDLAKFDSQADIIKLLLRKACAVCGAHTRAGQRGVRMQKCAGCRSVCCPRQSKEPHDALHCGRSDLLVLRAGAWASRLLADTWVLHFCSFFPCRAPAAVPTPLLACPLHNHSRPDPFTAAWAHGRMCALQVGALLQPRVPEAGLAEAQGGV